MTSVFGIIVCLVVALLVVGAAGFVVALKLGVIMQQATKPTHQDTSNYSLDQGREVRPESDRD